MDYLNLYINFLKKYINLKRPLRVVFDCSNGTTGLIIKHLFTDKGLKIKSYFLYAKPDGNFPGHGPNPISTGAMDFLKKEVVTKKADLGIIFDADGDRVLFVNDGGDEVSAEEVALLLGSKAKRVILTPNIGFVARELLSKQKKKVYESRVGHYFVKKAMLRHNADFGIETSDHIYLKKFQYNDSAILSAILFMNSASRLSLQLSKWKKQLPVYYKSSEMNFSVLDKSKAMQNITMAYEDRALKISKEDGIKMEFKSGKQQWWFLLRASANENLLRLTMEAKSKDIFDHELSGLIQHITKLGGKREK